MRDHCGCRAFPPIAELTAEHEDILRRGRGPDVTGPPRYLDDAAARLPASRWRAAPATEARGAADRVRLAHGQARTTVRLALAFVAAAAVSAAVGAGGWLPLHRFLAGGVVLAISGAGITYLTGLVLLAAVLVIAARRGWSAASIPPSPATSPL
jgi:hypothetical protein